VEHADVGAHAGHLHDVRRKSREELVESGTVETCGLACSAELRATASANANSTLRF